MWAKNRNLPGLAMSRSIGDGIGTEFGVINTPIFTHFSLSADSFIVMASDGVWNVIDNQEAVDFVDKFRKKTAFSDSPAPSYPIIVSIIKPEQTNIAHLLAEESRVRWYAMCEEDDVMVDDICVIVLDLETMPFETIMPDFQESNIIEPSAVETDIKIDPIRGSTAELIMNVDRILPDEINEWCN